MSPFSPRRFAQYRTDLALAVYDLSLESRRRLTPEMLIHEMREALKDITGYENLEIEYEPNGHQLLHIDGKVLEVGPAASNAEIVLALKNALVRIENAKVATVMSAIDRIKAKALQARTIASTEIREFESDLDGLIAEGPKLRSERQVAVAPHKEAVSGLRGEYDGMREAMAILSNGGPSLDPLPSAEPTASDSKG